RDGIEVSAGQRRVTAATPALFDGRADDDVRRTLWPLYHPSRIAEGRLTQSALAATLAAVAREGANAFYRGPLAQRLAAGAATASRPGAGSSRGARRGPWTARRPRGTRSPWSLPTRPATRWR